MAVCGITDEGTNNEQNHNTYLWNGMIHPLLQVSSHWLITIILSSDWLITTILTSAADDCQGRHLVPGRGQHWTQQASVDTVQVHKY